MQQTCDPMHARAWFEWREHINMAASCIVMAVLFFALMIPFSALTAFFIALGVTSGLYFFVLYQRTIAIVCPHCKGHIEPADTPWICPNKGCRNDHPAGFPFIHKCEQCDCHPKGYECHHCFKPIFFTRDQQKAGIAKCANAPVKPKPVSKDPFGQQLSKKQKDVQLTKLDVEQAKLNVELKGFNDVLDPPKIKSVRERLRSRVGSKTELDDEVRKMEAEANEKFKNEPVELEKQLRMIRDEARELL